MVDCGGLIFNRHKWVYKHKDFRVCSRCGEMQEIDYGVPGDLPWKIVSTLAEFNSHLLERLERENRYKINNAKWNGEKEKARKWITGEKKSE